MPKEVPQVKQEPKDSGVFEQVDERGRVRLDRPATGAEALAQDEAHRQAYSAERLARFEPAIASQSDEERREARRPAF